MYNPDWSPNSRDEVVNTLAVLKARGTINNEMIKAGLLKADEIIKAEEEKKLRDIEERKKRAKANNLPIVKFPKLWNMKNCGQKDKDELDEYIKTYDIKELEMYLEDLRNGACASDVFKNHTGFEASCYLAAGLRLRTSR
jgi:hypothetical protein